MNMYDALPTGWNDMTGKERLEWLESRLPSPLLTKEELEERRVLKPHHIVEIFKDYKQRTTPGN